MAKIWAVKIYILWPSRCLSYRRSKATVVVVVLVVVVVVVVVVCLVTLCLKSTTMGMAGLSVHLTTPFPGQA